MKVSKEVLLFNFDRLQPKGKSRLERGGGLKKSQTMTNCHLRSNIGACHVPRIVVSIGIDDCVAAVEQDLYGGYQKADLRLGSEVERGEVVLNVQLKVTGQEPGWKSTLRKRGREAISDCRVNGKRALTISSIRS